MLGEGSAVGFGDRELGVIGEENVWFAAAFIFFHIAKVHEVLVVYAYEVEFVEYFIEILQGL